MNPKAGVPVCRPSTTITTMWLAKQSSTLLPTKSSNGLSCKYKDDLMYTKASLKAAVLDGAELS